jgi:capsule polysaccharide modification protein KpsS
MRRGIAALALSGTLALIGCDSDECRSYSHYSCKEIEKADYNVFFYYPSDQERYLGQASGLNECQTMASNYAIMKEVAQADWSYVCCMIAHGSDCYEKHK